MSPRLGRSFGRLLLLLGMLTTGLVGTPAHAQTDEEADKKPKLTKAPKLTRFVEAPYPESEKEKANPAAPVTVVLRLSLGADGRVTEALVQTSGGPAFDLPAVEAAKKFEFEPAEIDGKPAPIRILYRYQFTLRIERRTAPKLTGVVRSKKTTGGAAEVTVTLDTGETTKTDASGAFTIEDVPEGKRTITLTGKDFPTQLTEETFERGRDLDVVYTVDDRPKPKDEPEDDAEVVVVAPPLQKEVVATTVPASEGRKMAGTQGDVLRVVENLPGVGRAAAGSGTLVVWGAAPGDTRVYVDGVRIPSLYHLGGLRSVIHGDLVKAVELAPGGYGAAYGRGLGGLVTVEKAPLFEKGIHGSASIDAIDSAVSARVPLGENVRFAIGARRSHLAPLVGLFSDDGFGELVPIPRFSDGTARLGVTLSPRDRVEIGVMTSQDDVERNVSSLDPVERKRERRSTGYRRVYGRWERDLPGGLLTLVPSYGVDDASTRARFGAIETLLENRATVLGLRLSYKQRLHPTFTLVAGLDGESVTSDIRRRGSIGSPAREGDVRVFGQAPSDQINVDTWTVTQASLVPFVEADWSPLSWVHLTPGLRVTPFFTSASRRTPQEGDSPAIGLFQQDVGLEPRLAARTEFAKLVTLKAAAGLYRQQAAPEELSAAVGSPVLPAAKSTHLLGGVDVALSANTQLESTTFYTRSERLVVRSPLAAPLLAQGLVATGEGRALGAQFLLRRKLAKRVSGWLSYTLLRSERRRDPSADYRLFDYDQTHVLTALGSVDLGKGFEVGARVRYATGLPRTPVVGTFYDARRDTVQPLFGALNGARIPAFFSLDLRIAKKFKIDVFELETFVDVQNATNRENPEEFVYARDYRSRTTLNGLPLLPSAGARWSF